MKLNGNKHLTYCLNVHPGETWAHLTEAIRVYACKVRNQLEITEPFGLGLRISGKAASEAIGDPGNIEALRDLMNAENLYAFTVNAFPFGRFHEDKVKDSVYRPDWSSKKRLDYTAQTAQILAQLLPSGVAGSISTCPLTFKGWNNWEANVAGGLRNLARAAWMLNEIARKFGRDIKLAIEPEPDCYPETTAEFIDAILALRHKGSMFLAEEQGLNRKAAEEIIRKHIGCCFDTAHQAVQFENLEESLARLQAEDICVPKIQASAAITVKPGETSMKRLKSFCDPVYLHQVRAQVADGTVTSRGDLAEALASATADSDREWRIHCHIPLYYSGDEALGSTANMIDNDFFKAAYKSGATHIEIETYTFEVLPPEMKNRDVAASIAEEYRWLMPKLQAEP